MSVLIPVLGYGQCGFNTLAPTYCTSSPSVQLSPSVSGGMFYGTGVNGSAFNPATAGAGTHVISYSYCPSTYSLQNEDFAQAAYSPTIVTLGDNTISPALPIGFNFRFFCNTYSQFFISSNGFITFTPPQSSGCCQGIAMPTGPGHNEMIAVAWTDLDPSQGGTIRYSHLGTAPNRTLLVSYNCIFHKYGQGPVTAEILLHEGSNAIEFSIVTKPVPTTTVTFNTTMGIQGPNGVAFSVPGRNGTAGWIATQEQFRFVTEPECVSMQTVQVIETPAVTASASKTMVCPGENVIISASGAGSYTWVPGNYNFGAFPVSPTATTVYTITGATNICSSSATLAVNVSVCNGLSSPSAADNSITIFPVPARGEVNLISTTTGTFYLIDALGRHIRTIALSDNNNFTSTLSDLTPGLYSLYGENSGSQNLKRVVVE